ncbi:hypothetical protein [Bacteroides stercoris]|uniref:hypothetical protein n=1 Tax=Bacteroides stercoris TaxID=46506 RepID=UPI00321C3B30
MTDHDRFMYCVHNASLILWYVATGLDLMELSIYALCVYRKGKSKTLLKVEKEFLDIWNPFLAPRITSLHEDALAFLSLNLLYQWIFH